jgi:hypothetical protein
MKYKISINIEEEIIANDESDALDIFFQAIGDELQQSSSEYLCNHIIIEKIE